MGADYSKGGTYEENNLKEIEHNENFYKKIISKNINNRLIKNSQKSKEFTEYKRKKEMERNKKAEKILSENIYVNYIRYREKICDKELTKKYYRANDPPQNTLQLKLYKQRFIYLNELNTLIYNNKYILRNKRLEACFTYDVKTLILNLLK